MLIALLIHVLLIALLWHASWKPFEILQLQDLLFHKDMAFSSLKTPPSPNFYDSIYESLCKPWLGIVNVLLNCGIHVGSCYCDVV